MLRVLLLDVGNTIAFLDVHGVAEVVRDEGHHVDPARLREVEGRAKRRYEALLREGVSHEEGWGLYLVTLLEEGGLDPALARAMIAPLRRSHDRLNLWRSVPADLPPALDRIRAAGVRLAIVSNSEGRLPELLAHVGLAQCFETIVDSHHEGVRKPDPEIFRRALSRLGIAPHETVYLGDIPGVDVAGANAAGIDAVLVDPYGFYDDFAGARVPSVASWIDAYLRGVAGLEG
ncbi:HAD family hydrolase [Sandaracinus amylolyticus]|uniref:Putative hydrolase n=1 Tax=Sandaracinus amylolyticus TaxID=927083 RepID=A0A0F6W852_9BACT|nr:HAD-IIIA family hydrolase [Sandaracinus amylolyticus]AKF09823.1 putative hydrolase [Sandaracinus amylolyticus]